MKPFGTSEHQVDTYNFLTSNQENAGVVLDTVANGRIVIITNMLTQREIVKSRELLPQLREQTAPMDSHTMHESGSSGQVHKLRELPGAYEEITADQIGEVLPFEQEGGVAPYCVGINGWLPGSENHRLR